MFDLSKKNILVITGTNVNSRESHYFNYITTPDMNITTALKISMCIPFFFNAVKYNENIYVDGKCGIKLSCINVNDASKVISYLLSNFKKSYGLYNLSSPYNYNINEQYELMLNDFLNSVKKTNINLQSFTEAIHCLKIVL